MKSTALAVIHCQTKMDLLENESVKRNATNYYVLQFLSLKCNGPRTQKGVEVLLETPLSSRSVTVFNMNSGLRVVILKNIYIYLGYCYIILTDLNSGGSCHLRSRPRGGLRCDVAQRQFDDQTL